MATTLCGAGYGWASFTPTSNQWVANVTFQGKWTQIGDQAHFCALVLTSGQPSNAVCDLLIESAFTISNKMIPSINGNQSVAGLGMCWDTNVSATKVAGVTRCGGNASSVLPGGTTTAPNTYSNYNRTNPGFTWAPGDAGWADGWVPVVV